MRRKSLEERLERNDCDNEQVFEFLEFLKREKESITKDFIPLGKEV